MTVIIDCPSCNAGIRPPIPAVCPDCGYALMAAKAPLPQPPKPVKEGGGSMNLYRVTFKIYRETYYVVASDARNAFHRAQIVITRNRSDYAERTHLDTIEVHALCDVDRLVLDALDEKEKDRGKTSWKYGQLQFICPKCRHTKRKLRYVQPIGEAGRVRHDTTDGGCGPKCFKGEHLHIICCNCGHRQWDYCADHVEAPASESGDGE